MFTIDRTQDTPEIRTDLAPYDRALAAVSNARRLRDASDCATEPDAALIAAAREAKVKAYQATSDATQAPGFREAAQAADTTDGLLMQAAWNGLFATLADRLDLVRLEAASLKPPQGHGTVRDQESPATALLDRALAAMAEAWRLAEARDRIHGLESRYTNLGSPEEHAAAAAEKAAKAALREAESGPGFHLALQAAKGPGEPWVAWWRMSNVRVTVFDEVADELASTRNHAAKLATRTQALADVADRITAHADELWRRPGHEDRACLLDSAAVKVRSEAYHLQGRVNLGGVDANIDEDASILVCRREAHASAIASIAEEISSLRDLGIKVETKFYAAWFGSLPLPVPTTKLLVEADVTEDASEDDWDEDEQADTGPDF